MSKNYILKNSADLSYLPTILADLNEAEQKVFNSNPLYGLGVLAAGMNANLMTDAYYYEYAIYNGNGDAFRHCFWNVYGAAATSAAYMKKFSDAHEDYLHNPQLEEKMDLWNNQVGIDYYNNNKSHIESYYALGAVNDLSVEIRNNLVRNHALIRFGGDDFTANFLRGSDSLGER